LREIENRKNEREKEYRFKAFRVATINSSCTCKGFVCY